MLLAGKLGRQAMLLSCQHVFHAESVLAGLLMVLVLWQRLQPPIFGYDSSPIPADVFTCRNTVRDQLPL